MSLSDELMAAKVNQKNKLIALGRSVSDEWETYPDEIMAVCNGTSEVQTIKKVNVLATGMKILADRPYTAMLKVILAAEPNFQPYNIRSGVEIWGKVGTATPAESEDA